ncbi:sensor histidine kinase [Streptomyces sp. CWNU-52H]|uniref:sensor histidine kinase n=1 Tax=Streptomyces sp. CWNU-52H TaxID=3394352 RepID=UPI0039BF6A97
MRGRAPTDAQGTQDTGRSLSRQSVLVAVVCVVADSLTYLEGSFRLYTDVWPWPLTLLAAIVLTDAALASSPRLSGVVAVVHAVVTVLGTLLLPAGSPSDVNDAGFLISAYRAGAWLKGPQAVLALACLGGAAGGAQLLGGEDTQWHALFLRAGTDALLPWLVGRYTTARRAYLAELEQRSEHERREARRTLTDAIAQERSAIARDLHDVIAHHVSAIGMHAGAARLGLASPNTSKLTGALTAVETSSRAAMLDLRRLLDLLHGNSSEGARQPGLDNLDELVGSVRAAGLAVEVTTSGTPRALPDSLDIAVYRVVQEMLTNSLRHGGRRVSVGLLYGETSIIATASNPLPPGPRPELDSPRRGLEGIRSRAEMFNGAAVYGPTPDGTAWTISATFPLDPSGPAVSLDLP